MNTMKHLPTRAVAVALAAAGLLSACGGGGGGAPLAGDGTPREPGRPEITAGAYAGGALSASGETYSGGQLDQPLVTGFERDGSGGFDITYRISGDERKVPFDADSYDRSLDVYATAFGNLLFEVTFDPGAGPREANVGRRLTDTTEFDHLDAYYTEVGQFDGPATAEGSLLRQASVGYFVHGEPTRVRPAGSATYSGRFLAKYYRPESVAPDTPSEGFLHSDSLSLTIDFADGSVGGTVERVRDLTEEPDNPVVPLSGRFDIDGTVGGGPSATGFEADLTGTGDLAAWRVGMEGRAFGPRGEEAGGALRGTNTDNGYGLIGYFAAGKP